MPSVSTQATQTLRVIVGSQTVAAEARGSHGLVSGLPHARVRSKVALASKEARRTTREGGESGGLSRLKGSPELVRMSPMNVPACVRNVQYRSMDLLACWGHDKADDARA